MAVLAVLLGGLAAVFAVRWLLLRRQLRGLTRSLGEIHAQATNRRLTVGSRDRELLALAAAINRLYEDIEGERGEHRRAADELRRSMADISHDLRTPLTSIIGYMRLLEEAGNTPAQEAAYREVIRAKADALHALVNSLFELARLEAGAYPFHPERLDAGELLGEELAGNYALLSAQGAGPKLRLRDRPLPLIADRGALGRVFANLLQNAARHGAGDICVQSELDGAEVRFVFSNRVEGFLPEDLERLFRRSFVADRVRGGESTGLGLSIVKEFVEQMGGTIAAGLAGETLIFTVRFPKG